LSGHFIDDDIILNAKPVVSSSTPDT